MVNSLSSHGGCKFCAANPIQNSQPLVETRPRSLLYSRLASLCPWALFWAARAGSYAERRGRITKLCRNIGGLRICGSGNRFVYMVYYPWIAMDRNIVIKSYFYGAPTSLFFLMWGQSVFLTKYVDPQGYSPQKMSFIILERFNGSTQHSKS